MEQIATRGNAVASVQVVQSLRRMARRARRTIAPGADNAPIVTLESPLPAPAQTGRAGWRVLASACLLIAGVLIIAVAAAAR